MDPTEEQIEELKQEAEYLRSHGEPIFAANLYALLDSWRLQKRQLAAQSRELKRVSEWAHDVFRDPYGSPCAGLSVPGIKNSVKAEVATLLSAPDAETEVPR